MVRREANNKIVQLKFIIPSIELICIYFVLKNPSGYAYLLYTLIPRIPLSLILYKLVPFLSLSILSLTEFERAIESKKVKSQSQRMKHMH